VGTVAIVIEVVATGFIRAGVDGGKVIRAVLAAIGGRAVPVSVLIVVVAAIAVLVDAVVPGLRGARVHRRFGVVAVDSSSQAVQEARRASAGRNGLVHAISVVVGVWVEVAGARTIVVHDVVTVIVDSVAAGLLCFGVHRRFRIVAVIPAQLPGFVTISVPVPGSIYETLREACRYEEQ